MAAMAGDITPRDGDAATDHATLPRILCVTVPDRGPGVRCAGFDSGHNGLSRGLPVCGETEIALPPLLCAAYIRFRSRLPCLDDALHGWRWGCLARQPGGLLRRDDGRAVQRRLGGLLRRLYFGAVASTIEGLSVSIAWKTIITPGTYELSVVAHGRNTRYSGLKLGNVD